MDKKDMVITYETLYELLRREKYRAELQKLDNTFFEDVIKYLREKKAIYESQQKKGGTFASSESQKTGKQLENTYRILKELYERRENKILQLALFASRTNDERTVFSEMVEEEKELYKSLGSELSVYRKGILDNLLDMRVPKVEKKIFKEIDSKEETGDANGVKTVRFLLSVPNFIGDDMNVYGPFEEEDVANLSDKVADLLIKRGKAEEVKIKK
jgi:DNA replication initiation complex subunit (GINS family)